MKILKKIFLNKLFSRLLIKPVLNLHSFLYYFAGRLGIILNDGKHPKHEILKYKEWFLEQITQNSIVLDVGCNTGMLSEMLSEKAKFVYGIDIDEKLINEARSQRKKDNIKYICEDVTKYDFSSIGKIDYVILSNVLEHIEKRTEFLNKMLSNILNDSINILIRVPMIEREWIVLYKKELGLEWKLDKTHFTEYTVNQLNEELETCGIIIENLTIKFGEIYAVCKVDGGNIK